MSFIRPCERCGVRFKKPKHSIAKLCATCKIKAYNYSKQVEIKKIEELGSSSSGENSR